MKHSRVVVATLLVALFFVHSVYALDESLLEKGISFTHKGSAYTVIENLAASPSSGSKDVDNSKTRQADQLLETSTATGVEDYSNLLQATSELETQQVASSGVVEYKGNMAIYLNSGSAGSAQSQSLSTDSSQARSTASGLPVVRNDHTGVLGIVYGNITVKLKEGYDAWTLSQDHKTKLISQAPGARLAFLHVSTDVSTLLATLEKIRADHRVSRASIEILEHPSLPH